MARLKYSKLFQPEDTVSEKINVFFTHIMQ